MDETPLTIGHIDLSPGAGAEVSGLASIVVFLAASGVRQHVVAGDMALCRRLCDVDGVAVGPTTSAPAVAFSQMPAVDVLHVHDERSAEAGLLMALTRSTPYIYSDAAANDLPVGPVSAAIYRRASSIVCPDPATADRIVRFDPRIRVDIVDPGLPPGQIARHWLRIYRRTVDSDRIPALLL